MQLPLQTQFDEEESEKTNKPRWEKQHRKIQLTPGPAEDGQFLYRMSESYETVSRVQICSWIFTSTLEHGVGIVFILGDMRRRHDRSLCELTYGTGQTSKHTRVRI